LSTTNPTWPAPSPNLSRRSRKPATNIRVTARPNYGVSGNS
jgi:hypothetical protein